MKKPVSGSKLNLLLLVIGRLITSLGSSIFSFALSLHVLDKTGSAGLFSTIVSLAILPGILVNIFGGVWIDKKNRKKIIIATDIISAFLVFAFILYFIYAPQDFGAIMIYTGLLSSVQALNHLAVNAAIPDVVPESEVPKANSLLQLVNTLLTIAGPICGAILYKTAGMVNILFIDSISFLGAAGLILFIKFNKAELKTSLTKGYLNELKEGYHYLIKQPLMRFLVLLAVIINGIYMPLMLIVIPFINYQVIKVSGLQLSIIEAAWAIGATAGGIYISTQKNTNSFIRKLFVLLAIQATFVVFWSLPGYFSFGDSKWLITFFFSFNLAIIGALNMVQNIPLLTYVQLQIPEEKRGRVLGFINVFMMASTPVGMFVYGFGLQYVNWMIITVLSGFLIVMISLIAHRSMVFLKFSTALSLEQKTETI